jgi:hypothetical protein
MQRRRNAEARSPYSNWIDRRAGLQNSGRMTTLEGWENFYVIVGSSAGALIGLQFVVITLIAGTPLARGVTQGGAAFSTPSIVHYQIVLLLSAAVSVPWEGITAIAVIFGLTGLFGTGYSLIVARRMRTQKLYQPVFEDWLFHALLPLAAYLAVAAAGCVAHSHVRPALFLVAAGALVLLFIGIHNAWDTVIYHITKRVDLDDNEPPAKE